METAELAAYIGERYQSLLGEADRLFEKFGGKVAIEAAEAPHASEEQRTTARAVREFAAIAALVRMGGDAEPVNFICGGNFIVGIEMDDPDGLAKLLAQLPSLPRPVLLELQKSTVDLADQLANRITDVFSVE